MSRTGLVVNDLRPVRGAWSQRDAAGFGVVVVGGLDIAMRLGMRECCYLWRQGGAL